jgi:hydroxymethylglutaryl-CoA synthase
LYLALASLLEAEAGELEGKRIGLFSYGSGCCAEYFAGTVQPGAGAFADVLQMAAPLKDRRKYTFAEYEQIRLRDEEGDKRPVNGEAHGLPEGSVAFVGIDSDRRVYIS